MPRPLPTLPRPLRNLLAGPGLTGPPELVFGLSGTTGFELLAPFPARSRPFWMSWIRGLTALRTWASGLTMKLLVILRLLIRSLTAWLRAARAFSYSGVPGRAWL